MADELRRYFRLGSEYASVLKAIYRGGSDGENALRKQQVIAKIRGETGDRPSPGHVFGKMKEAGMIKRVPGKSALFELLPLTKRLVEKKLREERLATPEVVRSRFTRLEKERTKIEERTENGDETGVRKVLRRVNDQLQEIEEMARTTRRGTLQIVQRIRAGGQDEYTFREKLRDVRELQDDYVDPLSAISRPGSEPAEIFKTVVSTLEKTRRRFQAEVIARQEVPRTIARVRRTQEAALEAFGEARQEVLELSKSVERESRIVEGASRLLETIQKEGVDAARFGQRIPLNRIPVRLPFSNRAMETFLKRVVDYDPTQGGTISEPEDRSPPRIVRSEDVVARARQAAPIDDLLEWVFETWPEGRLTNLLRAYHHVMQDERLPAVMTSQETSCTRDGTRVTGTRVTVRRAGVSQMRDEERLPQTAEETSPQTEQNEAR
jgi:hypothetical protein